MLNIDPARISSDQVTDKLFKARRGLEGIGFKNLEELFGFGFQSCRGDFLGIFLRLSGVDKRPLLHQTNSGEHLSTDVFKPRRIESRIFGIERRYKVSWIANQSSTEIRTPAFFFPTIWIGLCDFSDSARSLVSLAFVAVTVFIY